MLEELVEGIRQRGWLDEAAAKSTNADLARALIQDVKRTRFMDIGEFSRPVHAEMAALIDSARHGVSVDGHLMYVTTFPCHNCAKHIIAAGLRKIVYLEPYSKSWADVLYNEQIDLESPDGKVKEYDRRVIFVPFTGVGPRQYARLFSMSERGSKRGRSLSVWNDERCLLRPL